MYATVSSFGNRRFLYRKASCTMEKRRSNGLNFNQVTIYSHRINEMKRFYLDMLAFHCLDEGEDYFKLKIGSSILHVIQSEENEQPFYHFAFNIPSNLFQQAKAWVQTFTNINEEDGKDEIYFPAWKAHSFYFQDPCNNVVELISREDAKASTQNQFTAKECLNISEINLTTNNVVHVGKQLIEIGIPFDGKLTEDGLNFMGSKTDGAYILLGPEKRRWIFSNQFAKIYPVSIRMTDYDIHVNKEGAIQIYSR